MYRGKKEPCGHFMRGSCRFGDRCKFSHSTNTQHHQQQQQQQPNSPFGFGGGFAQQSKVAPSAFASFPKQQSQSKPFQNKWTRTPETNNAPATGKQSNHPSQEAADHVCNNPEVCKRQMLEDFQKERPLWRLTCYAHSKFLPCEIGGDISYEELRAAAYDDAKKGLSLSSVVERERNLVNSKLIEFENLLRNPCVISPNTISDMPSSFAGINTSASSATAPPPVSSFSQLGFLGNQGSNTSAVVSTSNSFGQQNTFPVSNQISSPFGRVASSSSNSFPNSSQTSNPFGPVASSNSSFGQQNIPISTQIPNSFGTQGLFGSQQQKQTHGNATGFSAFSSANVANNQSSVGRNTADGLGGQTENGQGVDGNMSIWQRDWNIGEIPEEAPPDGVCV